MSLLNVSGISLQEAGNSMLKDISFTLQESRRIAIAGETGSGKSTLLQIIAGLIEPSAGEVFFEGKKVIGPVEKLVPGHPHISYLSQQYELPQFLRVEQILKYANTLSAEEAETLYTLCRISHLAKRKTDQLSGGERQRIALARLLIKKPRLLLLDEPFSNLDVAHKRILKTIIRDIGERLNITCLLISHDPHDTLSWADEILVLQNGQIIQRGTPAQVYKHPENEYTAALFGGYNLIRGADAKAFSELTGVKMNGKNMLVRPERVHIQHEESHALPGKVKKVNYFGSHFEIEVQLAENTVTAKTKEGDLAPGDQVYVALPPDSVWYV